MGHERLGLLPKSKKWQDIVASIAEISGTGIEHEYITEETFKNVDNRFKNIPKDEGVISALNVIIQVARAYSSYGEESDLENLGIRGKEPLTPLGLAKIIHKVVNENKTSNEYRELAKYASTDAVAIWYKELTKQKTLLEDDSVIWGKLSTGRGFSEIARLFFAKFTERYLNYFIERVASSQITSIEVRDEFKRALEKKVDTVSRYAFETAKITESFAAGWFNKNVLADKPVGRGKIRRFTYVAFNKMREEFKSEGGRNGTPD